MCIRIIIYIIIVHIVSCIKNIIIIDILLPNNYIYIYIKKFQFTQYYRYIYYILCNALEAGIYLPSVICTKKTR